MSGCICRASALPAAAAARPRRLRLRRLTASAAAAKPSVPARLAAQLRQLKQFKVWDAPAASTSADASRPAVRGGRQAAPARQAAPGDGASRPGAGGGRRPGIVWFRGDLRLHDHEALARAQAECSSLLPVYCFNPRDYGKSPQGYDKTGPFRAQFLIEAVADLRAALRAVGSELVVRVGRPEEVISELARRTGAGAVYCHSEVSYEELQVEAAVKGAAEGAGAKLRSFWANTLHHLEDLPFKLQQLPQSFDKFKGQVEAAPVRAALAAPTELRGLPLGAGQVDPGELPTLQQLGLQPLPAGSTASSSGAASAAGAGAAGAGAGASKGGSPPHGATTRGGEAEALHQLQRFVAQVAGGAAGGTGQGASCGGGKPGAAAAARAGAPSASGAAYGSNFASSIAPWLATGCLSPRRMLEDVQRALGRGAAPQASSATTTSSSPAAAAAAGTAASGAAQGARSQGAQHPLMWVQFELLWRDFFRFMTLKYSSLPARQLGGSASSASPTASSAAAAPTAQPALAVA